MRLEVGEPGAQSRVPAASGIAGVRGDGGAGRREGGRGASGEASQRRGRSPLVVVRHGAIVLRAGAARWLALDLTEC